MIREAVYQIQRKKEIDYQTKLFREETPMTRQEYKECLDDLICEAPTHPELNTLAAEAFRTWAEITRLEEQGLTILYFKHEETVNMRYLIQQ